VLGVALIVLATSPAVQDWLGMRTPGEQLATVATPSKWPAALSSSEVALVRARNLYSRGRLAEALQALERVSADSPARVAADALRVEIEQLLLASGPDGATSKADRR